MNDFNRLKAVIIGVLHCDAARVTATADFNDLGCEEVEKFSIIAAIEKEFGIQISDDEALGIQTVRDAVSLVDQKTRNLTAILSGVRPRPAK